MAKFKRNSDAKTILMSLVGDANPDQAFVAEINKDIEGFFTSDYLEASVSIDIDEKGNFNHGRRYYRTEQEWDVTSETATKVLGLQFVDISTSNIPNESSIAFGSKYYSNDEQKAFALKYDCNISKSPAKTSYYFLNEEEFDAISNIQNSNKKSMAASSISKLFFTADVIQNAVNSYFDTSAFKQEILANLIQQRLWAKLMPNGEILYDASNKVIISNLTILDALVYAYKHAFIGKLAYQGTGIGTKVDNYGFAYPDLKFFHFSTTFYEKQTSSFANKSYNKASIYSYELTKDQIKAFNAGDDILLSIPLDISSRYRLSFERGGATYYTNTNAFTLHSLLSKAAPITVSINNKTPGISAVIRDDLYSTTLMAM
jgi:hypothetical protein